MFCAKRGRGLAVVHDTTIMDRNEVNREPTQVGNAAAAPTILESDARRDALSYYNGTYHCEHFGDLLADDRYYRLLAGFWRYSLFERHGLNVDGKVLDFGSGIGQVSAALPHTVCFDLSSFAVAELRKRGRTVIGERGAIPAASFDYLLSSHCLEHSTTPYDDLREFRTYVRPGGRLVLILPVEMNRKPTLQSDWNLHLFGWTFQTLTNLLRATGWAPQFQSTIYPPFTLRTLANVTPPRWAILGAHFAGRLRRSVPSMLTIAQLGG